MNASSIRDTDVLIVGAGPTGLVLALWLTQFGVRVMIVDKTEEAGTTSRAVAVQARILELYSQMGLDLWARWLDWFDRYVNRTAKR